jgi:DMSO/TMAO reductase YedYZ molybdopterin-dependent catalytic subunit
MKNNITSHVIYCSLIYLFFTTTFVIPKAYGTDTQTIFEGQELTEYQGQPLSSINDFVENSINGPQNIDPNDYNLSITGLVDNELNYTYNDILNKFYSYKKVVEMTCIEGWSVTILWEGFLVEDLLANSGINSEATKVIFFAKDGYFSSLTLDYILRNDIIMAYKMNNVTIPPERGFPFQLVAEGEMGDKWTKWITEIHLSNEEYDGWWDSVGAPSNADFDSEIIPEFPLWIILPLAIAVILFSLILKQNILNQNKILN